MASFAKQALLCAALAGTSVRAARVSVNLTEGLNSQGVFPVPLVGMSPDEIFSNYGRTLYPYLQADLIYLRRIWHADFARFEATFKDAWRGKYVEARKMAMVTTKAVESMVNVIGLVGSPGEVVGTAQLLVSWMMEAGSWANWMDEGKKQILEHGQDAPMRYIKDATMGNLWEAMVNVNAVQLVVAPREGSRSESRDHLKLFERKYGFTGKTLKAGTVVTPLVRSETRMSRDAIWVSYEDQAEGLQSDWVFPEDVVPSLYMAKGTISASEFASSGAPEAHVLREGELFAVTRLEEDDDGVEWMELSDGRGYIRARSPLIEGPVEPEGRGMMGKEAPTGNKALEGGWSASSSTATKCAKLAFNVGMFVGGFFTSGVTWAIATGVNAVALGGDAVIEQAAMTDLDMKLEYLLMRTRTWELEGATRARECHILKNPCTGEGSRCIREFAFHDTDRGEAGYGRCMYMYDDLPTQPDGEPCRIHADCESANCVPSPSCTGIGCVETTCQPFVG